MIINGLAAAFLMIAHPATGQATASPPTLAVGVRPAAAVVDAFHAALQRGDTEAAAALMADDALIYEGGGAERDKAEYAAGHLAADAVFSRAVARNVTRRSGRVDGRTAWIATESTTKGVYKMRDIDNKSVETMVLRREGAAWRIVHVHWSSAGTK